jgi:RNA polymerase sigma factor (sigma-70 family)
MPATHLVGFGAVGCVLWVRQSLFEEPTRFGRGVEEEDAASLSARVLPCMWYVARDEGAGARPADRHVVADLEGDLAAGTNLGAWLFTIMHNQNVNNVRREVRESAAVEIERVATTLPATTDPSASRKMIELDRALARLPLGQRQVILLVGLEGMSYEDTAGILDIPVGTVRSRLSRGRDTLRELLDMEERPAVAALPQAA